MVGTTKPLEEDGFTEVSSFAHSFEPLVFDSNSFLGKITQPAMDLWSRPQRVPVATDKSVNVKGLSLMNNEYYWCTHYSGQDVGQGTTVSPSKVIIQEMP